MLKALITITPGNTQNKTLSNPPVTSVNPARNSSTVSQGVDRSGFNATNIYLLSYQHNQTPGLVQVWGDYNTFGSTLIELGNYAEAEAAFRESLAINKKRLGEDHPAIADSLNDVGAMSHRQGNYAQAEALYREALAIRRKHLGSEHPRTAVSSNHVADALMKQHKYAEAETVLLESSERLQSKSADRTMIRDALERVVRLYQSWDAVAPDSGKAAQAEEWKKKLEAFPVEAEEVPGKQKRN